MPPNRLTSIGASLYGVRGSPESVDTRIELILLCPASSSCHVTARAQALSRWSPAGPQGPRRNGLDRAGRWPILDGREAGILGRLSGGQGVLVVHWRHHLQGGVSPVPVVVVDPGGDLGP